MCYLDLAERASRVVTETADLVACVTIVERMAAEVAMQA